MSDPRREIPSVDQLLRAPNAVEWTERFGRESVKRAVRQVLEEQRRLAAELEVTPDWDVILEATEAWLLSEARPALRRVLNGSGVVLHTNLGRAPLPRAALEALRPIGLGYSNLEFDLETGTRGSRHSHCTELLRELTGSEAALVVNNNAAGVALVVNEFALDRQVLVSRGELVEIGGSFRIPEIVARSGGELVEVGTTNRTRLSDYARAIGPQTGLILKVHPSNYRIRGFVEEAALSELVELGRSAGIPVANDLGSGLLLPELLSHLPTEPGPREAAEAGTTVVMWSGDKLLGGPQAGIVHGSAAAVARLRENPLLRAFRVDKLTVAALEATLRLYRNPEAAAREIPAIAMLREPPESVRERAELALVHCSDRAREQLEVRSLTSLVGGGAHPEVKVESAGWAAPGRAPTALERRCRQAEPPLIGRTEGDAFSIDFRTLLSGEEPEVARIVSAALEMP